MPPTIQEALPPAVSRETGDVGIALWRLHLLRAAYLLMAIGIGTTYTPTILQHPIDFPVGMSLAMSLLSGLGLVALLGLRYPLKMLPLLLFELVWKAIYLTAFPLPLWREGQVNSESAEYIKACLMVVVFLPVIPWDFVIRAYIAQPAEKWR